jgi:hypothetical protein
VIVKSPSSGLFRFRRRSLEPHLDPGTALRVEEVEGDALRARGGEELDRNGGEPEVDIEILQRARHRFFAMGRVSRSVECNTYCIGTDRGWGVPLVGGAPHLLTLQRLAS